MVIEIQLAGGGNRNRPPSWLMFVPGALMILLGALILLLPNLLEFLVASFCFMLGAALLAVPIGMRRLGPPRG